MALPWLPVAAPLGMGPLGLPLLAGVLAITGLYVLSAEFMKRRSRHLGL